MLAKGPRKRPVGIPVSQQGSQSGSLLCASAWERTRQGVLRAGSEASPDEFAVRILTGGSWSRRARQRVPWGIAVSPGRFAVRILLCAGAWEWTRQRVSRIWTPLFPRNSQSGSLLSTSARRPPKRRAVGTRLLWEDLQSGSLLAAGACDSQLADPRGRSERGGVSAPARRGCCDVPRG
jgi:hypothetical protein